MGAPALVLTTVLTLLATSAPAQAATRTELLSRANAYYSLSMREFMALSRAHDGKGANGENENTDWRGLDWENDGCSAPDFLVGKAWNTFFKRPCVRHDFGYRNFGKGKALHSTNAKKLAVDDRMLADMKRRCRTASERPLVLRGETVGEATVAECDSKAQFFYDGVRKSVVGSSGFTNPENAWHDHQCTKGALCLFDDHDQSDRRLTFGSTDGHPTDSAATEVDDLDDFDFGDKTSSVVNNSPRAWRLYDDTGQEDRSVCVRAGGRIDDLADDPHGFGDKTSSIKRLAGADC